MRGKLEGFALALALAVVVPAVAIGGEVPTCCSCQDCPAEVSACIELPPGTTDTAQFIAEVCQPLGCTGGAGCIDADCANLTLCTEEDQCTDGFDNDADGLTDCADNTCSADAACGSSAPAASWLGLGLLVAGLGGLGLRRLRQRRA